MSHSYAFIISSQPIDINAVNLPPYIGVSDTHPLAGGRCTAIVTGGARIEDGISAILAAYPDVQATISKSEAERMKRQ